MDHDNTLYHSSSFQQVSSSQNLQNNSNNNLNNKQALTLSHAYSFECKANDAIHNLSDAKRNALFFVSGHIGVIYDMDTNTQQHLLGHAHAIACCCVSADRAFIVTADAGSAGSGAETAIGDAGDSGDSLIIVWNSLTASPIRTLSPLSSCVYALDLSLDASLLAVISSSSSPSSPTSSSSSPSQVLSLYHWTTNTTDTPLASHPVPAGDPLQYLRFHPADPSLMISNSKDRVVFWHTFPSLVPYSPPLTSKDFRHPVGNFTQSTFLPPFNPSPTPSSNYTSYTAASATLEGDVVVWDVPPFTEDMDWGIRGIKALQLHQGPIKVLTATSDHIVTGGEEGFVRFFDPQFRILAWFEDLAAGSISAISFSRVPPDPYDTSEFKDSEFVVGTRSGIIISVQPTSWEHPDSAMRRGRPVLQAHCASVYGVASHPALPLLVTAGHSGDVHIWQYETQSLVATRRFDKLLAHRVAFSPDGEHIAIGFTNGTVRMVYTEDLRDVPQSSHRQSRDCITEIVFSLDGKYLATSDADRCVVLYQLVLSQEDQVVWEYIGKYRAHTKPITGLIFGTSADSNASGSNSTPSGNVVNRLISVAEDRTLVEFDVAASSVSAGLVLKSRTKIEQVAIPTAITWHPRLGKEDFLIVASDQYKFKLYNSNTKSCRKTILGPTYGGPLNRLVNIPLTSSFSPSSSAPNRYLAYGTHERVMGLIKLPLDGNPHRTMGLIAHAGEIAGVCASYDAQYIFSAGGADGTVYAWRADYDALDELANATDVDVAGTWDSSVAPFVALLNRAGASEAFWTEFHDYFYFAQLKSQGEDTMRPRHIGPTVPLAQVPHIMRGLGYYPTEREVEDLVNELKFTNFVDTGEQMEEVTLDTIIKAYVNHKPVFGVSEGHVDEAFRALGADEDGRLSLDYLLLQLQYKGEAMSETEIKECLRALLGEDAQYKLDQLKELTARDFAEHVLGFEPLKQDEAP